MSKAKTKEQERLAVAAKKVSQDIEMHKSIAEARRNRRALKQEDTLKVIGYIAGYIQDCRDKGKPLTIAGLQLAIKPPAGVGEDTRIRYGRGDMDYLLEEYISLYGYTESDVAEIDGIPTVVDKDDVPQAAYMGCSHGKA